MKKVRKSLAMVLAVSMLFGTQVLAADNTTEKADYPIQVTLTPANFTPDEVTAGDVLEFTMTATNVSEDTLGGFYWPVYTEMKGADLENSRFGNPQIVEADIPEIVQYNNGNAEGVASVLFANDSFEPNESISLTVKLETTEEMIGNTMSIYTEAEEDQGDILSNRSVCATTVNGEEVWIPMNVDAELVDADLAKVTAGQELTFKMRVTNPNETAVQNVYVAAGYSTTENVEDTIDFVDITGPEGVEMTEDGPYIAEMAAGETVEFTVKGTLPDTLENGPIYFLFGAIVTEEKDPESAIIGLELAALEGTVVEKETIQPEPKPGEDEKPQVNPPKKPASTTNKKPAPKTGDSMNVVLLMAMMLMAGGIVIKNKKRHAA